jgi:hypothetical protein
MKQFTLNSIAEIQLGSSTRQVEDLVKGESILTYDVKENKFELSQIKDIAFDKSLSSMPDMFKTVKINKGFHSLTQDALIWIKKSGMIEPVLGYFTDEKPVVEGIDSSLLYKVESISCSFFNGKEWEVINELESIEAPGRVGYITVETNNSFFVGNLLVSDYKVTE